LPVVAAFVVGQAEGVPGGGEPLRVAVVLEESQGLPAVVEGLVVFTEEGVAPANRVEGPALCGGVVGGFEDVECRRSRNSPAVAV
jgi:hypothetical protein